MDNYKLLYLLLRLTHEYEICFLCDLATKEDFSNRIEYWISNESVYNWIQELSLIIPDFSKDNLYNGIVEVKMLEIRKIINYIENIDGFSDYLINRVYESLLNELSNSDNYKFLINNLDNFRRIIDSSTVSSIPLYISTIKVKENEIPTLTRQELIDTVVEFFSHIDSTNHLTDLFLDYCHKGRILFWDANSKEVPSIVKEKISIHHARDWVATYNSDTDENMINAPCKGNLVDAFSLIHEFFHCLYCSIPFYDSIFCEFPSIFIEESFKHFLLMKGLKQEIVLGCMKFREENNIILIKEILENISFLNRKSNKEKLTKNELCKKYDVDEIMSRIPKNNLELYNEFRFWLEEENKHSDSIATSKLEEKIINLNGEFLKESIKYFVAKDLTIKLLNTYNIDECTKKLLSLQSAFINFDMSEHYYFSYLGIWDYYFLLASNANSDKIHPARIEAKERIKII